MGLIQTKAQLKDKMEIRLYAIDIRLGLPNHLHLILFAGTSPYVSQYLEVTLFFFIKTKFYSK